jgi:hypothetical protein
VFRLETTWITPWGLRLGGALRASSGLPFSQVESHLVAAGMDAVPVPRFIYPTGRRNDLRNAATWTIDLRVAKELNVGRHSTLRLAIEVFNLLDYSPYLIYNDALGVGRRIDGIDEATRLQGRRVQLGIEWLF